MSNSEESKNLMTPEVAHLQRDISTLHGSVTDIRKELANVAALLKANAEQTQRITNTVESLILKQGSTADINNVSSNTNRISALESKSGTLDKGTIGVMATIALMVASLIMVAIQWKIAESEKANLILNRSIAKEMDSEVKKETTNKTDTLRHEIIGFMSNSDSQLGCKIDVLTERLGNLIEGHQSHKEFIAEASNLEGDIKMLRLQLSIIKEILDKHEAEKGHPVLLAEIESLKSNLQNLTDRFTRLLERMDNSDD